MRIHIKDLKVGNLFMMSANSSVIIWIKQHYQNVGVKHNIPIFVIEAPVLVQKKYRATKLNRYVMKIIYNTEIHDAYIINYSLEKNLVELL